MKVFIFGLGYSALCFVRSHGDAFSSIAGTTRTPEKRDRLRAEGIEAHCFDADAAALAPDALLPDAVPGPCDAIIVSIAPDADGDPVLRAFGDRLAQRPPGRVIYLSTVGVYGGHDGRWVDETTPLRPASVRSRWRAHAEMQWTDFARRHGSALDVLRLAGIYGPARNAIQSLRAGKARRIVKAGQVFNRIHVADIAQTIAACLARPADGEIAVWNVTDDEPAPPQDVVAYAARLIGMEPPPEIGFADAQMTPMARSFYGENKRVSNRALRERLGVRLLYPNYREGLRALAASSVPLDGAK